MFSDNTDEGKYSKILPDSKCNKTILKYKIEQTRIKHKNRAFTLIRVTREKHDKTAIAWQNTLILLPNEYLNAKHNNAIN